MSAFARRALLLLTCAASLVLCLGCRAPEGEQGRRSPNGAPVTARSTTRVSAEPVRVDLDLPEFEPGSAERGKQLVTELECNRCHEGTGLTAPKLDQDCVRCHEQIATGKFAASPSKLAKWQPQVMPYRDVPSLVGLGARVRPSWLMSYLLRPHDLRPNLAQTMPRLALSSEQARDITTFLSASAKPAAGPGVVDAHPSRVEHGKQLMTQRGCVACHVMSGSGLSSPPRTEPAPRTLGLAPDLRFARERSEPAALYAWLLDPSQLKHDAAMPNLQLPREDARDLAAFLSFGALEPPSPSAPRARLPPLTRRVGFDEVNEQVFAVTCRHCHTNPDLAGGDGGPGNTGGFGFKPRRIDFSSYQGIQSGGVDAHGQRVSLFAKTSEGLPRLVAALLQRERESRGDVSQEVRGMPLGLPPLTPEQIQLVESWVEQGRPL